MKRVLKVIISVAFGVCLTIIPTGCALNITGKVVEKGNSIIQSEVNDFKKGEFQGTVITNTGNGEVQISKEKNVYLKTGVFVSSTIYTQPFQNMILSCNADTPEGTSVKIEVQVKADEKWSDWLNWGTWSISSRAGSNVSKKENDFATMAEDVLQIKEDKKVADAIKYRLTLNTENTLLSPSIKMIAISIKNDIKPIPKVYKDEREQKDISNFEKVLDVPKFSQTIRNPKYAMQICSPTCITMVMQYYGIDVLPDESASGVYDNLASLYGNWSFNCSYAGSYNLTAYTDYCNSLDDIRREIYNGHPVIASVRYKSSETIEGDLPVLHGVPIDKTEGHLVVVCGFENNGGKEYVVVNDPAAKDDESVRVKYLADEFEKAWFKVVYIIHKGDGVDSKPRRIKAELVPLGQKRQFMTDIQYEYMLKSSSGEIDLERDNIRAIMFTDNGKDYNYINPNSSKTLWFDGGEGDKHYNFLIITNASQVYTAKINWTKR